MRQPEGSEAVVVAHPAVEDASASSGLAFDSFYGAHRDRVGRCLALTLGDATLGFEAADEAMVRAFERWEDIRGGPNPSGWVYRTGLNWARSWLRRRQRSVDKGPLLASANVVDAPVVDTDLSEALAQLSEDHRAVVVLRYFLDWSVEQTADALEVSPGTVKSRLSRALDHLERRLDPPVGREGGSPR